MGVTTNEYCDLLKQDTINNLRPLVKLKETPPETCNVIGIVKQVSSGMVHFQRQQKFKTVMLIDPTTGSKEGVEIDVLAIPEEVFKEIGNIVLFKGVKIKKKERQQDEKRRDSRKSRAKFETQCPDCLEYPALQYDWVEDVVVDELDVYMKDAEEKLKAILRSLEEWFAHLVLTEGGLSKIPDLNFSPLYSGGVESSASWSDFIIGQVMKQELMELSDIMTIWDSSTLSDKYRVKHPLENEAAAKHKGTHPSEEWHSIQRDIPDYQLLESNNLLHPINVYRNWETYCHHWVVCNAYRCNDSSSNADFLLFCNIEMRRAYEDYLTDQQKSLQKEKGVTFIDLTLRSGQHKGKAVRVVKKHSILGRLFQEKLNKKLEELRSQKSRNIPDTASTSKRKEKTTSSPVMERVLRSSSSSSPKKVKN